MKKNARAKLKFLNLKILGMLQLFKESGKNLLIKGAIKRFIETEENCRVIYVSLS